MNRVTLSALAAALLAYSPIITAQDLPMDDAAWSRAVNLMSFIDPEKDAIEGIWSMEKGELISDDAKAARIQIPYEPPAEYCFRITFTRLDGDSVMQILSKNGHSFIWAMGAYSNHKFGFSTVGGRGIADNPTIVNVESALENNRSYTSIVAARNNAVNAYLDGRLITQWKNSYGDLRITTDWALPSERCIGLATHRSRTRFTSIQVLEMRGTGRVLQRSRAAEVRFDPNNRKPNKPSQTTNVTQQKPATTPAMPSPPLPPPTTPAKPSMSTVQPALPAMRVAGVKQTTFEVSNISTSSQYAYINDSWIRNALCVEVALRVNEDIGKEPPTMKAYFFNKNREMVSEHKHPTGVSFGNRESTRSPDRFHPGRKYTVYFGISQSIQRAKEKWKHVIVVFGNREKATADIHPREDIAQFDFPEKELVMKGRGR